MPDFEIVAVHGASADGRAATVLRAMRAGIAAMEAVLRQAGDATHGTMLSAATSALIAVAADGRAAGGGEDALLRILAALPAAIETQTYELQRAALAAGEAASRDGIVSPERLQ
jgi:hypothetical protein